MQEFLQKFSEKCKFVAKMAFFCMSERLFFEISARIRARTIII